MFLEGISEVSIMVWPTTNYCNYSVTKRFLHNAPYRKFSLSCKQENKKKTRKEHVEIKWLFNKVLTMPLYCKDMIEPWCFTKRCSWKFCKVYRETPMLELFFNKAAGLNRLHRKCFPMIFVNFSTTPIF